jgi:hypothetical protein
MGPTIIFDKSTLQSLSINEGVWLDAFYSTNITPLFFLETLADVGALAAKTPQLWSYPNVHHSTLCVGEMLGHALDMRGVPVLPRGAAFARGGVSGIFFSRPPEAEAFERWQRREFHSSGFI